MKNNDELRRRFERRLDLDRQRQDRRRDKAAAAGGLVTSLRFTAEDLRHIEVIRQRHGIETQRDAVAWALSIAAMVSQLEEEEKM